MKKLNWAVLPLVLILQSCGFSFVETGHVGVKTRTGKIVESGITEGMVMHTPFIESVHDVDVRLQTLTLTTAAYTKDIQQVEVGVTINFSLDPVQSEFIYRNGNKTYAPKIIGPNVLEKLKEEIGKYEAGSLVGKREEVSSKLNIELKEVLNGHHINLSKITLGNFDFSDAYERAVEAKQVASENAKEAQNKTATVIEEAKQQVEMAKAEAQSMKIKAQSLTQNKNLIEYEAIQKWNGVLPQYMMGNTVPFINMGK